MTIPLDLTGGGSPTDEDAVNAGARRDPRIRVNALAPGVVRTRLSEKPWSDEEAGASERIPLGRIGEPSDTASAALFSAAAESSWITGTTLTVDGGGSLR